MLNQNELVKYKLSCLANAEPENIETGKIEVYWEDEQGNEFTTEESITDIAHAAHDFICELETNLPSDDSDVKVSKPDPASAAIQFALTTEEPMSFLRCWNEGNFAAIRDEWPEAPEAVFAGADPLHSCTPSA